MRETFFLNQLKNTHRVALHSKTDFMVDGHFAFEIGGASKKVKQISDIANSFLAVDGIEIGVGNRIPLYLFGFLY